jgi:NADH:ubiquinone oxidoreductase subunit 3 (subunit A)
MIDLADFITSPVVAFAIYGVLVAILYFIGKGISVSGELSDFKVNSYASGEEQDTSTAAPGYRPFFIAALFFAVLHLGVLMLGTSGLAPVSLVYRGGLMLALLALILG